MTEQELCQFANSSIPKPPTRLLRSGVAGGVWGERPGDWRIVMELTPLWWRLAHCGGDDHLLGERGQRGPAGRVVKHAQNHSELLRAARIEKLAPVGRYCWPVFSQRGQLGEVSNSYRSIIKPCHEAS